MRALFDEHMPHFGRVAAQAGCDAQVDYLQRRLREAERAAAGAKAHAARADLLAGELDASKAALAQQQAVVGNLTDELKGRRVFAMQSIEMGRAETRMAKEREVELQAKIDRLEMTIIQPRMARDAPGGMR
jgi:hypothetical protein